MDVVDLHKLRLIYQPKLPRALHNADSMLAFASDYLPLKVEALKKHFPNTYSQPLLHFKPHSLDHVGSLRIGVVFSGGQAAGGHNVVAGLYDFCQKVDPSSQLIGFLGGPDGILENRTIEISEAKLLAYRNQGGFDLIGSGRGKIETAEQFAAAAKTVSDLQLDGLVIVGGDDSNTNAAFLAEYFFAHQINTCVIGVPKTIDGDLKNQWVEISFGFDSAAKTFAEIIGNIARDALSAKKYYHFIKLMGRTASHLALECALQTHPNATLISEEIAAEGKSLGQLAKGLANLICERAERNKDYGVILIPEGILEFIPEVQKLLKECNAVFHQDESLLKGQDLQGAFEQKISSIRSKLTPESQNCFDLLPRDIQKQLLLDRDPHGNVQVSKIETERLFIEIVASELAHRKKEGYYHGRFDAQAHFCGYEGRSCYPSNFDAQYCYSLGFVAGILIRNQKTGYMACVSHLAAAVEDWQVSAIPLVPLMSMELRKGKEKMVVQKSLVALEGKTFLAFKEQRAHWALEDDYCYPGPMQLFGPPQLTDMISRTLALETTNPMVKEVTRRDCEYAKRL